MAEEKAKKAVAKETDATTKKAPAKKAAPKKEAVKKEAATEPKKAAPKKAVKEEVVEKAPAKKAEPKKVEKEKVVEKAPAKKAAPKKAAYKPVKKETTNRVVKHYNEVVIKAMMEKFKYTSVMQVPKLNKIVINMGVGDATGNPKLLEDAVKELTLIAGQKPVVTIAKKSEASFKLREGQAIGTKVDLRGDRMYDFFEKLISIALPRVRDFRGVSKNSFDGHGNYTLGIKEQLIFAEIDFDLINKIRGMDVVIVTTAKTDAEAYELLSLLGMPFQR